MQVLLSNIWNMQLNKERQWPSFFSKLLICGFQLHFASIVTSRYLNDCMRSICVPFDCNSKSSNKGSILLLPASISLVFLTFIVNLLSVYQFLILVNSRSRAIWSWCASWCVAKENSIVCIQNHPCLFNSIWEAISVHIKQQGAQNAALWHAKCDGMWFW